MMRARKIKGDYSIQKIANHNIAMVFNQSVLFDTQQLLSDGHDYWLLLDNTPLIKRSSIPNGTIYCLLIKEVT